MHSFVKSDKPVLCEICAAVPGRASECTVVEYGYAAHHFKLANCVQGNSITKQHG